MKAILCILLFFPVCLHAQTINITTPTDTICSGSFVHFKATYTGVITPHFKWQINSTNTGTDSAGYTTHTLSNNDTVSCLLTNSLGDTIFAVSNKVVFTVQHMPVVSPIIGNSIQVCAGSSIILSDSTVGGVWTASNGYATVSGGVVTGVASGMGNSPNVDSIIYTIVNTCGSANAYVFVYIFSFPYAGFSLGGSGEARLCVGGYLLINDGVGVNGRMYSKYGDVSIVSNNSIIGIKAGIDYVYDVETNVCGTSTWGTPVYVYDKPTITYFTTPPDICIGDSIMISDSTDGLPDWQVSNSNAIINRGSGIIKGINPGFDTITLSVVNLCGSASQTTTVNILPPGHIISADSLCLNTSIFMADSTSGGIWSSADPDIANIDQSGLLSCLSAGSALINYTYGSCTVSKEVIVKPIPSLTGNDNLCMGTTTNFSGDSTGILWYSTDTTIAAIDSTGLVVAINPGIAFINYFSNNGCFATKEITINPIPAIIGDTAILYNASTILQTSIDGGIWNSSNSNVALVDRSGLIIGNNPGTAIITYTLPTGCYDTMAVSVSFTKNEMVIFPNPAKNEIIIYAYPDHYHSFSISAYDGRKILQQPINTPFTKVNIQSLPVGIYLITLYGDNNRTFVRKFLKE